MRPFHHPSPASVFVMFLVADTQLYKRLCPSVRPLVRHTRVVTLELKSGKTRISAPAHPSATGGRVSGLVLPLTIVGLSRNPCKIKHRYEQNLKFHRGNQCSLTDEKNGGEISVGGNDENECDFKYRFRQKNHHFHFFDTFFDEEFKNHGTGS